MIEKNMFDCCILELNQKNAGISVDQRKTEHDAKVVDIDTQSNVLLPPSITTTVSLESICSL